MITTGVVIGCLTYMRMPVMIGMDQRVQAAFSQQKAEQEKQTLRYIWMKFF